MKSLFLIPALLALTLLPGCRDEEGPMQPGIYETTVPGGATNRVIFNKDGTLAEMEDYKPKPIDEGKWWRKGGKLCLETQLLGGKLCFDEKPLPDGGFSLTAGDRVTEFRLLAR